MQVLRDTKIMNTFNAGDFAKIIAALLLCAAKEQDEAPDNHKGIHVSLDGGVTIFSAIRYGQTTEVEILSDMHHSAARHFFLSFEDLETLYVILAYDANAPVQLSASRQPLTHHECLCISVDDWYTGYMGALRGAKHPFRTRKTRERTASARDLAMVYHNLTPLAVAVNFKINQSNPERETVVTVVRPLPGIHSVKSYLY